MDFLLLTPRDRYVELSFRRHFSQDLEGLLDVVEYAHILHQKLEDLDKLSAKDAAEIPATNLTRLKDDSNSTGLVVDFKKHYVRYPRSVLVELDPSSKGPLTQASEVPEFQAGSPVPH